jgi:hypothetical protein
MHFQTPSMYSAPGRPLVFAIAVLNPVLKTRKFGKDRTPKWFIGFELLLVPRSPLWSYFLLLYRPRLSWTTRAPGGSCDWLFVTTTASPKRALVSSGILAPSESSHPTQLHVGGDAK